jgi:hypothetical protein
MTTSKPALLWPLRPDELRWAPVLRSALRAVSSICCLALVVVGGASAQLKPLPGSTSLILKGKAGEDITGELS